MTPEGRNVAYIKRRIKALGGLVRKVEWSGYIGAPDLFIMLGGRHWFVEMKAPGQKPRRSQLHEHELMRSIGGCAVYVLDSYEAIDSWIEEALREVHTSRVSAADN